MNYFTVPGLKNKVYPIVANMFDRTVKITKDEPAKYCISPHAIMTAVCDTYKISIDVLKKKSRKRISVEPRQVFFYLMKHKTILGLEAIGDHCGKNHATVISGIDVVQNAIDTNSIQGNIATTLMQKL